MCRSPYRSWFVIFGCSMLLYCMPASAEKLTTAHEILSLPYEQSITSMPVKVEGVVTAAEPDWRGQFFVQDETGGIFVENLGEKAPQPGDRVRVQGVSHPGAFAPIIGEPRWEVIGRAELPEALVVNVDDLMLGVHDGLRVEVAGIVRSTKRTEQYRYLYLSIYGHELEVRLPSDFSQPLEQLIGAMVKARGTTATHYNYILRSLTGVAVYVPHEEDLLVLAYEQVEPFTKPLIPLNEVAQYRRNAPADARIHVRGQVTYQQEGLGLFLQDETAGIRVWTDMETQFRVGEVVHAVGFLEFDNYFPAIQSGIVRSSGEVLPLERVKIPNYHELRAGKHHAELITLEGKLIDRSIWRSDRLSDDPDLQIIRLLVNAMDFHFIAEYRTQEPLPEMERIPLGSVIEAEGVCVSEVDLLGTLHSLRLMISSPDQISVIQKPSWLTPRRLILGLIILVLLLAMVLFWAGLVMKKNNMLRLLLIERDRNQKLLQDAHDTLEQKVEERGQQLKIALTAKKKTELEHKAILTERTRLARDLHDTLEQTLTGIMLRIDTACKLFESKPTASLKSIQTARKWLSQSQQQLKHSIWDLRSRELDLFDLERALHGIVEASLEGIGIEWVFSCRGELANIPEIHEENLLRIGQEAITNVVKHSHATRVEVSIVVEGDDLLLRVEDNGQGFNEPEQPSIEGHHFGLLGMRERSQRINGELNIRSAPGRGTIVEIRLSVRNKTLNRNLAV